MKGNLGLDAAAFGMLENIEGGGKKGSAKSALDLKEKRFIGAA